AVRRERLRLHILKTGVIADCRHFATFPFGASMPPPLDPVPRPLDHLAERGRDDDPALVLRGEALSYKALRTRVGQLASWLPARDAGLRGGRAHTSAHADTG